MSAEIIAKALGGRRVGGGWMAPQSGGDVEVLRKALRRDGQGRASGPLGQALDFIAGDGQ